MAIFAGQFYPYLVFRIQLPKSSVTTGYICFLLLWALAILYYLLLIAYTTTLWIQDMLFGQCDYFYWDVFLL